MFWDGETVIAGPKKMLPSGYAVSKPVSILDEAECARIA